MIHYQAGRDRERCHCKWISLVEEKQEKALLKLDKPQPQLDAGKPWLWYGQLPCFIQSQGIFRLIKLARSVTVHLCVISALVNYLFSLCFVCNCNAQMRGDKSGWVASQSIREFSEITTKSSCVCGFLFRYISTAVSLSDLCLFLWSGNTVKEDCGVVRPNLSCSVWGTPDLAWLPGHFMETVCWV